MYKHIIDFIKSVYGNQEFTPLAVPVFIGNEKKYLNECIDTTFVSSVGKFVDHFEKYDMMSPVIPCHTESHKPYSEKLCLISGFYEIYNINPCPWRQ